MMTHGMSCDSSAATDSTFGELSVEGGKLKVGSTETPSAPFLKVRDVRQTDTQDTSTAPQKLFLARSKERSGPQLRSKATNHSVEYRGRTVSPTVTRKSHRCPRPPDADAKLPVFASRGGR